MNCKINTPPSARCLCITTYNHLNIWVSMYVRIYIFTHKAVREDTILNICSINDLAEGGTCVHTCDFMRVCMVQYIYVFIYARQSWIKNPSIFAPSMTLLVAVSLCICI